MVVVAVVVVAAIGGVVCVASGAGTVTGGALFFELFDLGLEQLKRSAQCFFDPVAPLDDICVFFVLVSTTAAAAAIASELAAVASDGWGSDDVPSDVCVAHTFSYSLCWSDMGAEQLLIAQQPPSDEMAAATVLGCGSLSLTAEGTAPPPPPLFDDSPECFHDNTLPRLLTFCPILACAPSLPTHLSGRRGDDSFCREIRDINRLLLLLL